MVIHVIATWYLSLNPGTEWCVRALKKCAELMSLYLNLPHLKSQITTQKYNAGLFPYILGMPPIPFELGKMCRKKLKNGI